MLHKYKSNTCVKNLDYDEKDCRRKNVNPKILSFKEGTMDSNARKNFIKNRNKHVVIFMQIKNTC